MALFDAIYMVDWSANNSPKTGRDSIWIAEIRRRNGKVIRRPSKNPPTRFAAKEYLLKKFISDMAAGLTVLAGFDFPQAYPKGFAAAAGLMQEGDDTVPPWLCVWRELSALVEDDRENRSNRFIAAASLNHRVSGGAYPFWGHPPGREIDGLSPTKPVAGDGAATLPERRLTDRWVPRAQPVWKLYTTGSVGSQALVGIPVLAALRRHADLAGKTKVWPFETGLSETGYAGLVLAEIYPSIFPLPKSGAAIKDRMQVENVVSTLAARDASGDLSADLAGPKALTPTERRLVECEEGWILGAGTLSAQLTKSER